MAVSVPGASAAPAIAAAAAMASSPRIVGVPATKEFSGIRRSWSEPQLRCSVIVPRAAALKKSRSMGVFPFSISGSILPGSIRSFLFDSDDARGEMRLVDAEEGDEEAGSEEEEEADEKAERANWVERLLEVRTRWRDRKQREEDNANYDEEEEDEDEEEDEADYYCGVSYDTEDEEEEGESKVSDRIAEWDRDSFSKLLVRVPWSDAMLFSQLAHLSNLAYVIPEIKAAELRKWYDLLFVTSSLEKKAEAAAVVAKLELDSTRPSAGPARSDSGAAEPKRPVRPAVAYDIAASAASYVHSRAKGLLSLGARPEGVEEDEDDDDDDVASCSAAPYKSEVAAYVAASTMTSVVAAEEAARREAAKDLRSLHSSPCEWFVCDEPATHTRCFVIQGSDSLASWQANLLFEPTKFENTGVPVHRGIYEAAKGSTTSCCPRSRRT
uniref:Uncharacterized protein n=1 Tax=Ananas comosus var. bracteatus TaxID=296719 RepID=A0A6V7PTI9_ANACO|nr:unnamed protein product [Ananas comosus var. bracteatus]